MNNIPELLTRNLRAASVGLVLAVLAIFYGQALGIVFGANEAAIKNRLKASAMDVRATVYKGEDAAMKPVLDRAWAYMLRAHLHAGGMGTSALALIVFVCLLNPSKRITSILSAGLGFGALGYSLYWMWAGFRAPGLGGTGAAKESLQWLAIPASGAFVLATVGVIAVLMATLVRSPRNPV